MNWKGFVVIGARILGALLPILTDEVRDLIADGIRKAWAKAVTTENPLDNLVVETVAEILGIDLEM